MRRVVITGMGIVSPLGRGVKHNWEQIINGKSGVNKLEGFDTENLAVKIGGQVPYGTDEDWQFDPDSVMSPKEQKRVDKFILYGLAAAMDAVEDSGWKPEDDESKNRTGVMIGSGIGGLGSIHTNATTIDTAGPNRISPFFIPSCLINLVSGHVSIKYGFRGPNHSVVTACSTGTHAIGDAARMVMLGDADVMVAGGAEAACNPLGLTGFARAKAVTTSFNDNPEAGSRPWDKDRSGFVMGEGSGIVVLEEYEHAKARGAKIYAEVVGYGMSGDGYHITAPASDGNGARRAMEAALKWGDIDKEKVDYINAHGTSTPLGDVIEAKAVSDLFGDHAKELSMSSTKSAIGHLLGAAGAVEAIYTAMAVKEQMAPPTLNLDNIEESCEGFDLVPNKGKKREIRYAMSNSFGFGGTNSSIILKKVED